MSFGEEQVIRNVVEDTFWALSKLIPAKNKLPLQKYDLNLVRSKYRNVEIILSNIFCPNSGISVFAYFDLRQSPKNFLELKAGEG